MKTRFLTARRRGRRTDNHGCTMPDTIGIHRVVPQERSGHELQDRAHMRYPEVIGPLNGGHMRQLLRSI